MTRNSIFNFIVKLLFFASITQSVVIDLSTGTNLAAGKNWLEIGFASIDDRSYTSITSVGSSYVDPIILIGLPENGGSLYTQGTALSSRLKNVVKSGTVSFSIKLFQPNDSYCSKQFHVPAYITTPIQTTWCVVEKGAFNVSSTSQWSQFTIGIGYINRTNADVSAANQIWNINVPSTCRVGGVSGQSCAYPQSVDVTQLGAVATIQTLVYETYMLLRTSRIRRRDITLVETPHDATAAYFNFPKLETAGYMMFMTGRTLSCVEKLAFETKRFISVTSTKLYYRFTWNYARVPGIFGHILTQNSFTDSTGLRTFGRNLTSAFIITQEDYCDGSDPIHTTPEIATALVVGELSAVGTTVCGVIYTGPTDAPTFAPSVNPTFRPSVSPTRSPTFVPSVSPTRSPTFVPSVSPTFVPSVSPTFIPSVSPTFVPSVSPTFVPTRSPTFSPSGSPTFVPSVSPTFIPSVSPTFVPSVSPTFVPSASPTFVPSVSPTFIPSGGPTFVPSVSPTFSPSVTPTFVPSASPTFIPSTFPTFAPTYYPTLNPTFFPTSSPTPIPSTLNFLVRVYVYTSFGDVWNNLQFVVKSNEGDFNYSYANTCNCSNSFAFVLPIESNFNVSIEQIDPTKPVRHPWETFYKYVDPRTGQAYYGQLGSTLSINYTNVIGATNMVNISNYAKGTGCHRCHHPTPKDKQDNGKDNSKEKGKEKKTPDSTPPPIHHRVLSQNESGGPGNGGAGGPPKRPPLEYPFALFDEDGDGWYREGYDQICPGNPDSLWPASLTYPRYSIISGDRTTLIHQGTICGAFSMEACQEVLPYDGKFVFRVTGFETDPNDATWDFCGVHGTIGEELDFQMVKGKCIPGSKRSTGDFCQGIQSLSVWSGSLLISSSTILSSNSITTEDSKILQQAIAEVLHQSNVHIESLEVDNNELTVSFTITIILEDIGYVGLYSDELEAGVEYLTTSMENIVSNGILYASLQNAIHINPTLSGVTSHIKSISLLSFEMTSLTYQTKVTANRGESSWTSSQGDDENNNNQNNEENNNQDKSGDDNNQQAKEELKHISYIGHVSGAIALVVIVLMIALLLHRPSQKISSSSIQATIQDSDHSTHSLLSEPKNPNAYRNSREVYRFH